MDKKELIIAGAAAAVATCIAVAIFISRKNYPGYKDNTPGDKNNVPDNNDNIPDEKDNVPDDKDNVPDDKGQGVPQLEDAEEEPTYHQIQAQLKAGTTMLDLHRPHV